MDGSWRRYKTRRAHARIALATIVLLLVPACSYQSFEQIDHHFSTFKAEKPRGNTVAVCSAYGCRHQTRFRFAVTDLAELRRRLAPPHKDATPEAERHAIAQALGWMEKRVGDAVGTSADRPGDDLAGNGDPAQMDCVDVATNLTSYLLVLESNQLLRHHTVGSIIIKEDMSRGTSGWTHYATVLVENGTRRQFAVDGWQLASGTPPEIVDTDSWYIGKPSIELRPSTVSSTNRL
jgi:hypothetical protein